MLEVCPHNDCTGCSACASICPHHAISMVPDEWGFMRPQIDAARCIDCGSCRKVCPALNKPDRKERLQEEQFYAAYHKDNTIRMGSSSGGAFSALATSVLLRGGYVCAAAFDEQCRRVKHIIINDENDMPALRTSKYTQSDMGDCMPEVKRLLRDGKEVFFAGTPCQVSGLHLYLRKDYPNLTTADIVCHGVPSPRIYQDYVEWLEKKHGSELNTYSFRDKRWSWWRFNMKASFKNGAIYYGKWEADPYYRGFLNDVYLRECCYHCQFSKHVRYGDITLSDFWGYKATDGGFPDDDKGISMCMLNTEKGAALFRTAKERLIHCSRPRQMGLSNGAFMPREQDLQGRESFLKEYRQLGFEGCIDSHFKAKELIGRWKYVYIFGRGSKFVKLYDKWQRLKPLLKSPRKLVEVIKKKIRKAWMHR